MTNCLQLPFKKLQTGGLGDAAILRKEARAIAKLCRTEPLIGNYATENASRKRAGQSDIIHLAAHAALYPVPPMFSRILIDKDSLYDGSMEAHEGLWIRSKRRRPGGPQRL